MISLQPILFFNDHLSHHVLGLSNTYPFMSDVVLRGGVESPSLSSFFSLSHPFFSLSAIHCDVPFLSSPSSSSDQTTHLCFMPHPHRTLGCGVVWCRRSPPTEFPSRLRFYIYGGRYLWDALAPIIEISTTIEIALPRASPNCCLCVDCFIVCFCSFRFNS